MDASPTTALSMITRVHPHQRVAADAAAVQHRPWPMWPSSITVSVPGKAVHHAGVLHINAALEDQAAGKSPRRLAQGPT